MKKIKLTKYEQDIEDNLEKYIPVKNQAKVKKALVAAAKEYMKEKKPITIRVSTADIEAIKIKAEKFGVPYQTYINILIHREATLS
jgi:predicted DNA binding CopG/RHH family protein